ncbi:MULTISPECIES: hypothetical protein [Sulfurimonas]|nr:hypothetical protein [Sulfurimonas indica]
MHKSVSALLIFFLLAFSIEAKETKKYSFRVAYGYASEKDLGDILFTLNFSRHPRDLSTVAVDGGYLLYEAIGDMPLELYAKGGLSYFYEDQFNNTYEAIVYLKLIYNLDFYENRVRFGFGEGVSYVNDKLESEVIEARVENDKTSKFLNYLDITIDFDIGRVTGVKALEDVYFGYLLKHRSGVFGLYNGVHGGSNYNSLYIETNF